MINLKVQKFIEIGPGKVLSGLVKRIDRNVEIIQVNGIEDLKKVKGISNNAARKIYDYFTNK